MEPRRPLGRWLWKLRQEMITALAEIKRRWVREWRSQDGLRVGWPWMLMKRENQGWLPASQWVDGRLTVGTSEEEQVSEVGGRGESGALLAFVFGRRVSYSKHWAF